MKVSIENIPRDCLSTQKYPDVSKEVYVPDGMRDEEIAAFYESRHKNIHHVGINVVKIVRLEG